MQGVMGAALYESGQLFGFSVFSAAVDPALIGAVGAGSTAVPIPGVAVGDLVLAIPPDTLEAGLAPQGFNVTGAGTGNLRLTNASAAGIDGASRTWQFIVIDRTILS